MNLETSFFAINVALNNYTKNNYTFLIDENLVSNFDGCFQAFSKEINSMKEMNVGDSFIEKWVAWLVEQITVWNSHSIHKNDIQEFKLSIASEIVPMFQTGVAFAHQYNTYILPLLEKNELDCSIDKPIVEKNLEKVKHKL